MWEIIRANRRRSVWLFVLMGIILVSLGFVIGLGLDPNGGAAIAGIVIALAVWGILMLIALTAGSSILLSSSKAKEITRDVHPQLFNIVEEMKLSSGMTAMPRIYIINTEAPNAFATGISPEKSSIAVTAGLLARLNRDELQGVVAHEMSHIVNRDVRFMTIAGVMLGAIVIMSEIFLRGLLYSGGGRGRKGGGQAQIVILAIALIFAILAPILARLLYFAISRKREYLADASAARLTRYPEGLASALEKIASSDAPMPSANKVTAPMYICNPLKKTGKKLSDLSSTHPPISRRIQILRAMSGGAGFNNYQEAYSKVSGKSGNVIPASGLTAVEDIPLREGMAGLTAAADLKTVTRTAGDIMMKADNYTFINCDCGLKFKIPEDYKSPSVFCTRCGKEHRIVK